MRLNEDGKTVAAMDILAPGLAKSLVVHKEKKDLKTLSKG
jgi:hypothetical protein